MAQVGTHTCAHCEEEFECTGVFCKCIEDVRLESQEIVYNLYCSEGCFELGTYKKPPLYVVITPPEQLIAPTQEPEDAEKENQQRWAFLSGLGGKRLHLTPIMRQKTASSAGSGT